MRNQNKESKNKLQSRQLWKAGSVIVD